MSRLEQTLEKSRLQKNHLGEPFASPPRPHIRPAAYHVLPSDAPPIDEALMERNRIIAHRRRDRKADIYRQLRTKILHIMNQSNMKSLAITSPHYGDGKTTVGINLAISMALDVKQTVLMVDLDLRKPSLHNYLGIESEYGLTDYLLDDAPLQDCLARPPFERVSILPAGSPLDHSSEILGAPKMIALAHELENRYPDRVVIYDMPPALDQDDAIAFLPQVDAVLVVVRDGVTREDDLKHCLASLSHANVIGTVLNNCW